MMDPESPVFQRAQVIGHTLWVTPYDPDERWPCGEFVVQSEQDEGLPVWTAQNRSIDNTDVVLWYVFGIHHITRPEDWPVMPVDTVSFWLKPVGFFDRNPALDVPPTDGACHEHREVISMATAPALRELRNFVNGEFKSTQEGATLDIVNPSTGEAYATSPLSGAADVDEAMRAAAGRVRGRLARHHPERADGLPAPDGRRDRGERRAAGRDRGREHRQAEGPDAERRDPADVRPDPLLRRRRPLARRAARPPSTCAASARRSGASRSASSARWRRGTTR